MHIILTEAHLERLEKHRIYFTSEGSRRLLPGDTLIFNSNTKVGKYSAVLGGIIVPTIGSFSYTQSQLPDEIRIGRYCSIAPGVGIIGGNHPTQFASTSSFAYDPGMAIFRECLSDDGISAFPVFGAGLSRPNRHDVPIIEDDVWIGGSAVLSRGITIGTGSIIAAQSVVTKSVPPYAIVGGNPARVIRMRFTDAIIERFIASRWWEYKVSAFNDLSYNEPERFLDQIAEKAVTGKISKFSEDVLLAEMLNPG